MKIPTLAVAGIWAAAAVAVSASKPNFVVVLTDDQDLQMDSLNYMQGVKHFLTDQGTFFSHHFCTVALCCPSRVNMWTGKAAHNTNVTDLAPPFGGYDKFIEEGYNRKWLPVWLQNANYSTYFTGKLMNAHTINNYKENLTHLSLDGHDFMLEPGTYQYTNATFQHNTEDPKVYQNQYATDVLANKSLSWIDIATQSKKPFFLAINPVNPHNNLDFGKGFTPPVPAPRYANLFPDAKVPRTANFNPDFPSGASWVHKLDKLNDSKIAFGDMYYRRRLQALQAVDDLVNRTIAKLQEKNVLDNTYIIYTSDNGFHIGQHRLTPGKRCPYEEDINVPMIIRGPGVPKNATVNYVTSHTDIAPTIVKLAGATGPGDFDGSVIPLNGSRPSGSSQPWEHVQVEHWGSAADDQAFNDKSVINTYKAIRVLASNYSLYYSVWCDGSHEVYDMGVSSSHVPVDTDGANTSQNDPHQIKNLYNSTGQLLGVSMDKLINRLDTLTLVLKACKGDVCREPWTALDKTGNTQNLLDALKPKYDSFYASQNKTKFDHCAKGYNITNELPIKYMTFGNHSSMESRNAEAWANWAMFTD